MFLPEIENGKLPGRVYMHQILIYSDSLTWGIIPNTRNRLPFDERWPGVLENILNASGHKVRVIEDCLNGRRTVWDDPFKPGRKGLEGLAQRVEINSPLSLVILMLGTNDFQVFHPCNDAWSAAQGIATLVNEIRKAPIEPGMPVPPVLIVCPPQIQSPRGNIAAKFRGAELKCAGLAEAYLLIASSLGCYFFDAQTVTNTSSVDGVHLDRDQHLRLGNALAETVHSILTSPGVRD
jgi:lysophospholipase L1-like esterase